jgi:hypothetical protein
MKNTQIALHLAGRAAVGFGIGLATGIIKGSAVLARKLNREKKQPPTCPHCKSRGEHQNHLVDRTI